MATAVSPVARSLWTHTAAQPRMAAARSPARIRRRLIEPNPGRRRQQLYGRRKGPKLTAHQSSLRETLLPELTLDIAKLGDPLSCFSPPLRGEVGARRASGGELLNDIWLEIGFGAGEH